MTSKMPLKIKKLKLNQISPKALSPRTAKSTKKDEF